MKYYNYENFKNDTNKLIKKVRPLEFEMIVGIARGGLTLAHSMAEGLDIREVQTLRTELYDKTCKREELSIFDSCKFDGEKRVLVVDDIADSGETLDAIMKHLKSKYSDIEFTSAALFYKKTSIYEPDFWINEANEWVEFFWEKDFKEG
ncbi:phosphoribosyltransferase [Sulfurimonas aquatica]|uniref:Phosphoribosyltransferase n=1 Tax=Sulfurimonas aquatica TaxID=2672570 RepID=A0A975B1V4_9BACT|nr:phosphoribosyltransferase family protein [Sulfurimonas aquatica]QSZ42694.1 phosphoribosyltransferase [Sulfurimonas aquatica]